MREQKILYNYSKLAGRIKEICGTQEKFAFEMGLSARTVSLKLLNRRGWNQSDIAKAICVLKLTDADIQPYFFCRKSSKL